MVIYCDVSLLIETEKVSLSDGEEESLLCGSEEKRPANAPSIDLKGTELQLSAEASAVRCNSKGRGSVYNPIFGICCHFCRFHSLTLTTLITRA